MESSRRERHGNPFAVPWEGVTRRIAEAVQSTSNANRRRRRQFYREILPFYSISHLAILPCGAVFELRKTVLAKGTSLYDEAARFVPRRVDELDSNYVRPQFIH